MRQSRHRHTFYRQPSCTFSYYGRIGNHRYLYRRANAAFLIKPSRSMNDLYEVEARHRRGNKQRNRHRSGNTNSSSGDTESEEGEVMNLQLKSCSTTYLFFRYTPTDSRFCLYVWQLEHCFSESSFALLRLKPLYDCFGSPC